MKTALERLTGPAMIFGVVAALIGVSYALGLVVDSIIMPAAWVHGFVKTVFYGMLWGMLVAYIIFLAWLICGVICAAIVRARGKRFFGFNP